MFKNGIWNQNVDNVKWMKAAVVRAIKTMAQTAVGMLVVGTPATEVDWMNVLSVSAVAGAVSILTSIAGIPEVGEEK